MAPVAGEAAGQPQPRPQPLLEIVDLEVAYGPVQVLFGTTLAVPAGGRVAVLGPNGVGKTTMLRAIAGLVPVTAGTVRFQGRDVTRLRAHQRARLGMALVEGGKAVFPSLSVLQNLRMGAYPFLAQNDTVEERIGHALSLFPPLANRLRQPAGTLSGGEQQMLGLGRALMAEAEILLFDELSLGLAPIVLQELLRAMEELAAQRKTMLIVEQSVNIALALAETVHFMEKGQLTSSAPTAELIADPERLRAAFLGSASGDGRPRRARARRRTA